MKCSFCGHGDDTVVDSRAAATGEFIRRRRECKRCHRRSTTYEYAENVLPHVVKRDGRREPFDRMKFVESIRRACAKRPLETTLPKSIAAEVESQLSKGEQREVKTSDLAEAVMAQLLVHDHVAYIRYAIGRQEFKTPEDMRAWLKAELAKLPKLLSPRRVFARP